MADIDKVKRNIGRMIDAGAPESDIDAYLSSEGVTVDQLKAPKYDEAAAKERMYEGRARAMRKASPTMTGVRDTVTRFVEGTPIGSFFDEAMAGVQSVLPESLGGQSYTDAKGVLDADRRIRDEESTKLATLPFIGDVTAGGVNKLAGAVASAPLAPVARVFQGTTMLPRAANVALSGAGYGGLYGLGEGNTSYERAGNAGLGAGIGATVGAVAQPIAQGVGNAVGAVRNRMMPLPQELAGRSRSAVDRVIDTADMDRMTPAQAGRDARLLGDEGMLADVGENMTTVTEGLAQQPGPARDVINRALQARGETAPVRINEALDQSLGHPVDMQASIDAIRQHTSQAAGPLYQQFYGMRVPESRALDVVISRIRRAVPGAFGSAQRMAVGDGTDPRFLANLVDDPMTPLTGRQGTRMQRVWQGVELDYLKRAVDDASRSAPRGSNEHRILSGLARQLRTVVDETISPGNPAASPWAQARAIAGGDMGEREALELGYGVFRGGGRAPEQVAADMAGMSVAETEAFRAGGRTELRNMMGRAATNFGPSGDRVARRALNSEFNRANVGQMTTPQGAARITNRIDTENTFADTANQVMHNSATARRQAARDMIPRQYDPASMKELRGTSLTGIAMEAVGRVANYLTAGALNERNRGIARDMAEMLVAQGAPRDEIVRGLMTYARQIRGNAQQRAAIAAVARDVLRGATQPAISASTND